MTATANWSRTMTRPRLLGAVLACVLVGACGSENRESTGGLTEPTPVITEPTAAKEFVVHNTLNRADDRSILDLQLSYDFTSYVPMISTLLPWAWDDFTSPVDTTIRSVSWQGAYCSSMLDAAQRGASSAKSFRVSFGKGFNGLPFFGGDGYAVNLTPAEAHEQFAFDGASGEFRCAYYDYTAVLPTPFPLTASTRYWLLIRAESDGRWGWRVGIPDNGVSARGSLHGTVVVTEPKDLAFSLSNR